MADKFAYKMRLKPGAAAEYRRRHEEIWPGLLDLCREAGLSDYSIHLDAETETLFAVLWRAEGHRMADLKDSSLMREWWAFMADLMQTHPDNEPVAVPLETVFHLE